MRQRNRQPLFSEVPFRYGIYNYETQSSSTLAVAKIVETQEYEEMSDVLTALFLERRSRGEVIVNPMAKYTYRRDLRGGVTEIRDAAAKAANRHEYLTGIIMGMKPAIPATVTALSDSLLTQAVTSAYAGVADPNVAGVVSLAELKDTWALLKSPYNGVRSVMQRLEREKAARLRALRKKGVAVDSRPPPPEIVSLMADLWLKYRYGLMPLLYDIQGIIKTLQEKERKPKRETSRGRASGFWTESGSATFSDPGWGETRLRPWTRNWEVSVRAGVLYEFTSTIESDLGLTMANLPSAYLDLIRLSFVLDWFVNVSDYVSALTATLRGDVKGAWATTTVTCSHLSTCTSTFVAPAGSQMSATALCTGAFASELHAWKSRRVVSLRDIGVVSRLSMSDKRYADAASLLWGALKTNLRPK